MSVVTFIPTKIKFQPLSPRLGHMAEALTFSHIFVIMHLNFIESERGLRFASDY